MKKFFAVILCISVALCAFGLFACGENGDGGHVHNYIPIETLAPTCTQKGERTYICACGDSYKEEIIPLNHDYVSEITPPTCTAQGYTTYTCSRCKDSYIGDYVNAIDHDYIPKITLPTCTAQGYTTYTCSRCKDSYTGDYTEELGHDFGEWVEIVAPTCAERGEERRVCSRDGTHFETRKTTKLNHDYVTSITAPTCTAQGYTTYTCSRCNDSYTGDYIEELGHNYEWTTVKEPTETEKGLKTGVCTRCGNETEQVIPELNHEHDFTLTIVPPTCTKTGYTVHSCACGEEFIDDEKAILPHTPAAAVEENREDATCTEDGEYEEVIYCSVCGTEISRRQKVLKALGHDFGEWEEVISPTCTEKGEKRRCCSRDQTHVEVKVINKLGHNYVQTVTPPTCLDKGYTTYTCSRCADSYNGNTVAKLGHDFGDWVLTKAPTCTEKGEETRYCSHDITHTETRKISELGHDYSFKVTPPTCTVQGYTTYTCSRCGGSYNGDYVDALGHDYIPEEVPPTCIGQGHTTYTCSRCGDSYTNYTNALGHDYTPEVVPPTCAEQGYTIYTCLRCGDSYVDDYEVELEHNYQTIDEVSWTDFFFTEEKDGYHLVVKCDNCGDETYAEAQKVATYSKNGYVTSENVKYDFYLAYGLTLLCSYDMGLVDTFVTYADFGAVGDGVTDDFDEIRATHTYANANGLSVRANDGATYYIGAGNSAIIKTNTDFGNAEFIIDDLHIAVSDRTKHVFTVSSDRSSYVVSLPSNYSLARGQKSVNLSFTTPVLLCIENSDKKDYIRYGLNENSGNTRQEVIIVDQNGKVDSLTPVVFDYEKVTKMTAYPIDDAPITVKGGVFTTIANATPTDATYYNRGIEVRRSNTLLSGITHYVTAEGETGCPYNGFYSVSYSNDVVIKDCVMTGRKTYKYQSTNGEVSIGSYDTHSTRANAVTWEGCTQSNDITDKTYWGVMASGYCKNLTMKGCNLSRFDAHQGLYNASLIDCTLGQNISVVGEGTLYIENVHRLTGGYFLQLRNDYGSTWQGDIIIKDCTMETTSYYFYLITATWVDWNFGYDCYLPNVTVDNVTVTGAGKKYVFAIVTDETLETVSASSNPMTMPEEVTVLNSGSYYLSRNSSGLFDGVTYVNN